MRRYFYGDFMPANFSFDIDSSVATTDDFARLRLAFTRLGWEPVGSSAWRYPRMDQRHLPEDIINHVFPIGDVMRKICIDRGIQVRAYSLMIDSTSDFGGEREPLGTPLLPASEIKMWDPGVASSSAAKLSEHKLRRLIAQ